jgi:hypothetical protein
MPPLQQRYFDILMERVRADKYPSLQLLDRLEAAMSTPDQVSQYFDILIDKVEESWYPSGQIMDRIERILSLVVAA